MTIGEKEQLFSNLLDAHKAQVFRVCWGFTHNSHDVEDLFQEVMISLWKGMEGFRKEAAWSTWIYRITVNTCILWQKKKKKNQKLQGVSETAISPNELVEVPTTNPRILALRKAIQQLKKMDRSLILLMMEEFTYQEISEITGLSPTNVGVRISRAKTKIKSLIENQ